MEPLIREVATQFAKNEKIMRSRFRRDGSDAFNRLMRDTMDTLAFYLEDQEITSIEKELTKWAKGGGAGADLWGTKENSARRQYLKKIGQQLHDLMPSLGTSQEGSIDNFLISLVSNSSLGILGSLDDPANRKRTQMANSLGRTSNAIKALEGLKKQRYVREKKLFTAFEHGLGGGNANNDLQQYGTVMASEKEINNALNDLIAEARGRGNNDQVKRLEALRSQGAHNGGLIYSDIISESLNNYQQRSASVELAKFEAELADWVTRLGSSDESTALHARQLFKGHLTKSGYRTLSKKIREQGVSALQDTNGNFLP